MKIIKPYAEILSGISEGGIKELQFIEKAARTCYKSENKITEDGESAKALIKQLIKSGHEAMLEHSSLSVKFVVDRGVSHEIVRHRLFSFAQESTRYCNYSKDKFGGEISINMPTWIADEEDVNKVDEASRNTLVTLCQQLISNTDKDWTAIDNWLFANLAAETAYMNMIAMGHKPQEARVVLPLDINTELVHTGLVKDWKHFFDLRALGTTGAPHPDAKVLALPLMEEFKKLGYVKS